MATYGLSLQVGQTISARTTQNDNIAEALEAYVADTDGPVNGTTQQKLDHIRDQLIDHMLTRARLYHRRNAEMLARQAASSNTYDWSWDA